MKKIAFGILVIWVFSIFFIIDNTIYNKSSLNKEKIVFNNDFNIDEDINIIVHRGATRYAPENTLPAYEIAGQQRFWGAECDTKCTKDGIWILMHDSTVDRTTNGVGNVTDLTFKEIKKLKVDVGANIKNYANLTVPTLKEYIEICKKYNMVPIIEVKESLKNDYPKFIEILKEAKVEDKCIVLSFSVKDLLNISKLNKTIKLQLLIDHPINKNDINNVIEIGNCGIDTKEPTKDGVEMAHKNGLKVNCYLINSINRAREVINMGVDQLTSDWINELK